MTTNEDFEKHLNLEFLESKLELISSINTALEGLCEPSTVYKRTGKYYPVFKLIEKVCKPVLKAMKEAIKILEKEIPAEIQYEIGFGEKGRDNLISFDINTKNENI